MSDPRPDNEIRADLDQYWAINYSVTPHGLWQRDRMTARLAADVAPLLARVAELEAENAELTRAHRLMSKQFETMRNEKGAGWQLADDAESERDAALARIAAVRALCDDAEAATMKPMCPDEPPSVTASRRLLKHGVLVRTSDVRAALTGGTE